MKAIAVFPKEKKVRLIEHPEPTLETATQVKIKILEVGVCGTDREICEFKYGNPPEGSDYLILGHESLGIITDIGSGVTTLKPGDLVVIMVRRPCPEASCIACRVNQPDFCYTGLFKERGINQLHGFMTEYVVAEEKYVLPMPSTLAPIGVLTEPLTIAEKSVREVYDIQRRLPWNKPHHALVLGAGPVGLLAAVVFAKKQFDVTVYSLEKEDTFRARLAEMLGGKYISAKTESIDQLQKHIPADIDVIFDGSGASGLAFELMPLLGYNGVFVWTGIPGRKEPIDVNAGSMMRNMVLKNQNIVGCVNAARVDFRAAIENLKLLFDEFTHLPDTLIKRYPIESYEALLLHPPDPNVFKSVIQLSRMEA
ncbi:MAG: hypothetical protein A3E84_04215 [Gammaproteobacteria bacterium RIFCSPHIGHO2_12_FULL_42_13]|nr:MAG: hypothetical protein A3E84_04215 [Gammaproteobacteria bacterium RIFCSPHIGHO2_12_FULL_42_13]